MPSPDLPFPPMETQLVAELPEGEWQYEPKWDGFRGVVENLSGQPAVWSRNGRPLLRYFPELTELASALPARSALDGEIILERDGKLDFDALQLRLHPAESRIKRLSAEIPAAYVAFDCLLWEGEPVHEHPLEERRSVLEAVAGRDLAALAVHGAPEKLSVSPASRDYAVAVEWLEHLDEVGLDGVVAKRLGLPYLPGSRQGAVKIKRKRTADCVIVGFRWSAEAPGRIASILLGLYDEHRGLHFVGHASGFQARVRSELERLLPPLADDVELSGERIPGAQSRWSAGRELDWVGTRPELVCEVGYDKLQGNRFRHGTKLLRLRSDKNPEQCTLEQVLPPANPPGLSALLDRAIG